jgi:DNA polymerase-3 subunit epsilon
VKVLGLDFETTGLDVKNDRVIEIGAALFDTDRGVPLSIQSQFVSIPKDIKLSQEIVALTGVTDEDLVSYGVDPCEAFSRLVSLINEADAVLAHNGKNYDFPLMVHELNRHGMGSLLKPDILFVDSQYDVPYPKHIQTRKLEYLASEHGFLNPFAHRALFDVLTMIKVVSKYSWDEVLSMAHQKDILLRAVVSFDDKDKAKARGYQWDGDRRFWLKKVKENQVLVETKEAPFKIQVLEF